MKLFAWLLVFLSLLSFASAVSVNDYLDEFNIEGETCSAIDSFYYNEYWVGDVINYRRASAPVILHCCKGEVCTPIIFDLHKQRLFQDHSSKEIIDLNYVRYQIQLGNITETYFVSEGANSCYFHGEEKLHQETRNLVADTTEEIALAMKTKKAKQVADTIKLARAFEIVSPFVAVDFGISYACHFQYKKLERAVETLGTCNQYVINIGNGYAKSGYINGLSSCFSTARIELADFYDRGISKVKCGIDGTINWGKEAWSWLDRVSKGEEAEFNREKTECEIAKAIATDIEKREVLLHHPRKTTVFNNYATRINQKERDLSLEEAKTTIAINDIKNITPSAVEIAWKNIGAEPDYNLSKEKEFVSNLWQRKNTCEELHDKLFYNSAIKCYQELQEEISKTKPRIIEEIKKEREKQNNTWAWIIGILVFVVVVYLIINKEKK